MVRTARLSDADDIARLTMQLGYEVDGHDVAARLSRLVARPDHVILVAEAEGRVVGWLHATVWEFVESGAFVAIGGLVVEKSRRRQGIGRLLMIKAEEWAVERGCSVVRLWSSLARVEAHQFYEELGYSRIKTQYAFAKSVGPTGPRDFDSFVPRVDGE